MIKAISSLNTNIRKSNETSFGGSAETSYVNSNEYIKDEFVKNIEDEKKSIITWANDRIGKLNSILEAIAQNDEMPRSEKPMIAAADFHTERAKNVLDELERAGIHISDIKNEGPATYGGFTGGQKNVLNNRVNDASNLTAEQKKDFQDKINRSYYEDNQQSFGQGNITDPYTPDETIETPGADNDSCEECGSDDSDCSDCASDTADCVS